MARMLLVVLTCEVTVGKVLAPVLESSGWNNQRESLVAAVVFARAMNRTLVVPSRFNPSANDRMRYRFEDVIDVDLLGQYLPVEIDDEAYEGINRGLRLTFAKKCQGLTLDMIQRAGKLAGERSILLDVGYNYDDVVFKNSLAYSSLLTMEAYAYLHPRRDYYDCALKILDKIKARAAVHLRVATRIHPNPLIDCEAHGYVTKNDDALSCVHANDNREVTMDEHVMATLHSDVPIYAATNELDSPLVQDFLRQVSSKRRPVYVYQNVSGIVKNQCKTLREVDVSLLEQVICALATKYYASFYSSWDEWPLHMRQGVSIHDDQQLALWVIKSKARAWHAQKFAYQNGCVPGRFHMTDNDTIQNSCHCDGLYKGSSPQYGTLRRFDRDIGAAAKGTPMTVSWGQMRAG